MKFANHIHLGDCVVITKTTSAGNTYRTYIPIKEKYGKEAQRYVEWLRVARKLEKKANK